MDAPDSATLVAIKRARALLKPPVPRESPLAVIAAAAFFAISALSLSVVILVVAPASGATPARIASAPK